MVRVGKAPRLAAAMAVLVAAGLLPALRSPDRAEAAPSGQQPQPVNTVPLGQYRRPARPALPRVPVYAAKAPIWPAPGTALAVIPAGDLTAKGGDAVTVAASKARQLSVQMLPRERALAAGRDLVWRITPADKGSGPVTVSLDVSGFAGAYGADWADRLRLAVLPECGLTTPTAAGCGATRLPTSRTGNGSLLSATLSSGGGLMTLMGDPTSAGGTGDYAATSLAPSATWSAGGNSGGFSWSYALRVPPPLGGPSPQLSLAYSAQAVDGRMSATNNQPSWIGEGFSYSPGYIERRYIPCGQDMDGTHNNGTKTGDLCWKTDNATFSLNGKGSELLYNSGDGLWHARDEDGSRIERLAGAVNGARNGEYWVLTTLDGTRYFFGLNRLRGWTAGAPETNSVQTVPVYGNHSGEPCHAAAFTDSACTQAYRWNLDYVVDPHGNTMSLWWNQDTNRYGANNSETDLASYVRDAYLDHIDYGTHQRALLNGTATDSVYAGLPVPMRVVFGVADRCLSNCYSAGQPVKASWSDTPWDLRCTAAPCDDHAPAFYSTHRLAQVTNRVWDTTASPAGFKNVEQWTLTHSYPDPTDGTRAGMWLASISHSGLATGPAITAGAAGVPDITFTPIMLDNRVDTALLNGLRPMRWARMSRITTETGATVTVNYAPTECVAGSPRAPESNTKRCYPVRTAPEDLGGSPGEEIVDWFHKYVVVSVIETDATGPQADTPLETTTSYQYLGGAAWRYADDDGLTKDKYRTWNQWRGYATVRTYVGLGSDQTRTDTRYFRGMHGDRLDASGGTKTVTVTDSKGYLGVGVNDLDEYAGTQLESVTYSAPSGSPLSGTVARPWASAATATRTIGGQTVYARFSDVSDNWQWSILDGRTSSTTGSPVDRVTHTHTDFDSLGLPVAATDDGDIAVSDDEKCKLTDYVRNTTAYLVSLTSRVRVYAVTCAVARTAGHVFPPSEVIGETRTSYDHQAWDVPPTLGEATQVDSLKDWVGNSFVGMTTSRNSYDAYGRVTDAWDINNLHTSTVYTPAADAPVLSIDTFPPTPTGQTAWKSTVSLEPAFGLPVTTVDINNRRADETYDALGRLVGVWKPGRSKSTFPAAPSIAYVYSLSNTVPSVVETRTLGPNNNQISTFAFYDALLRPRQTQAARGDGAAGRVVTDTFYDTAGRVWRTYGPYVPDGSTGPSTVFSPPPADNFDRIDLWTKTFYDSAGRPTAAVRYSRLTEQFRTTTQYPSADRVDVVPPAGGAATTTVTDAQGRTAELRQHHDRTVIGTDPAGYDSTQYHYNAKNQLDTVTNPAGTVWSMQYDLLGRLTRRADPDKGTTDTTYLDDGRVDTVTDARGVVLIYDYDSINRRIRLYQTSRSATNQLAGWGYDGLTNAKGMQTSAVRYVDGSAGAAYTTAITGVASNGKIAQLRYTIPAAETGLAGTYTYNYTYKQDGSVALYQMPGIGNATTGLGTESMTYVYSDLGQPRKLTNGAAIGPVPDTSYTEFGELGIITLRDDIGSGQVQIGHYYDTPTRRLNQIKVTRNDGSSITDTRFSYDRAGNPITIAETAAAAGPETQCFEYDHLRRLRDAWTPTSGDCLATKSVAALGGPAPYWTHWDIDQGGNRTQQIDRKNSVTTRYVYPAATAAHPHAVASTTDAGNVTTGTYTYDQAGNTTCRPYAGANTCPATPTAGDQILTWNPEGHLATSMDATGTTSYLYDADGTRLIRTDPSGKTLYLPGQELRVNTTGTTVLSCSRYLTWAGRIIATRAAPGGLTWIAPDRQNSTNITINAASQAVSMRRQAPYGGPRGTTLGTWPSTLDKGFVGGTNDNTGLTHLGAREYDPRDGRFISVDPVQNLADPQQWNGYAYAGNNPVTFADPSGLEHDAESGPCSSMAVGHCRDYTDTDDQPGRHTPYYPTTKRNPDPKYMYKPETTYCDRMDAERYGCEYGRDILVPSGCHDMWQASRDSYIDCIAHNGEYDCSGWKCVAEALTALVVTAVIAGCALQPEACAVAAYDFAAYGGTGMAAAEAGGAAAGVGAIRLFGGEAAESGPFRYLAAACSFGGDTKVLLADGTSKPISAIEIGDKVLATDPATGRTEAKTVTELWVHNDTLIALRIDGKIVQTTGDHPFWNATDHLWEQARDLDYGDDVVTADGRRAHVNGIVLGPSPLRPAYNLTVADLHTYYVMAGTTPVLVHNDGGATSGPLFVDGQLFEWTMTTPQGNVTMLAETHIDGTNLTLADVAVYGDTPELQRGALNPADVLGELRSKIAPAAASQGFTNLQITGTRATGPVGHQVSINLDLSRYGGC